MASDKNGFFSQIIDRIKEATGESLALVAAYFKQETVDPVKALGNFLLYGALGSVLLGFGSMLLIVAILRVLQEETAVFHGNLSWVPYVIVALIAAGLIALAALRITAGPAKRRIPLEPKGGK